MTRARPALRDANVISIECGDCGRSRWRKPAQILTTNISLDTPLCEVTPKFYCQPCRELGNEGKNITVDVMFFVDADRANIELQVLKNQVVLSSVSRAKVS
jgi:hypothetical protein